MIYGIPYTTLKDWKKNLDIALDFNPPHISAYVLTVEKNNANSHKGLGWEMFTKKAIEIVSSELNNVVFILWGKQAQSLQDIINVSKHHIISSVHPSPLSAHRGFFGSKPFSKANNFLNQKGVKPIDWKIN